MFIQGKAPGILFAKRVLWPLDYSANTRWANEDLRFYESNPGIVFADLAAAYGTHPLRPGKLAQSIEGAGKRRIFAIGNYLKQRLLHPVHEWAMAVLRRLPPFNQERPIHRLIRVKDLSSFDLKSATDRWPLSVMHDVMSMCFGPTVASCIVNGTKHFLRWSWCDPLWCVLGQGNHWVITAPGQSLRCPTTILCGWQLVYPNRGPVCFVGR